MAANGPTSPTGSTGGDESQRLWDQSLIRKKEDLDTLLKTLERKRKKNHPSSIPVVSFDEAIQYSDMEAFQGAVQRIAAQFTAKNVSNLLSKYVYPKLDHVKFFQDAISSATQADPSGTASLVFGLLLIVIQVSCSAR